MTAAATRSAKKPETRSCSNLSVASHLLAVPGRKRRRAQAKRASRSSITARFVAASTQIELEGYTAQGKPWKSGGACLYERRRQRGRRAGCGRA